jgi:hypothetical protein
VNAASQVFMPHHSTVRGRSSSRTWPNGQVLHRPSERRAARAASVR